MESLLSTYASSDDEDYQPPPAPTTLKPPQEQPQQPPASSSLFSKLPEASSKPSSSLFSSLPTPQSKSTPLFSLPPHPNPKPKRVIQFHPPQFTKPPTLHQDDDDDDEEEDQEDKDRKKVGHLGGGGNDNNNNNNNTCVKSSLLSSLPAPKNSAFPTLGSSNSSSARRSLIDVAPLHLPPPPAPLPIAEPSHLEDPGLYDYDAVGYAAHHSNVDTSHVDNYGGYGEHQYYYDEGNTWNDNAIAIAAASHSVLSLSSGVSNYVSMGVIGGGGKRRRDQPPAEILEVKQDELMKNRPTEDKSRLTGMTFGPSYQPASSKGKPSKLHKRKHQISSLYFDMKEKASELNERRAKGFLTKAETHAKYGW